VSVGIDNRYAVSRVAQHLVRNGHKKALFLGIEELTQISQPTHGILWNLFLRSGSPSPPTVVLESGGKPEDDGKHEPGGGPPVFRL